MRSITIGIGLLLMLACGNLLAQTPNLPEITKVPPSAPYRWDNVVIRAGGFVSGLEFSSTVNGLVYARTDVGGAAPRVHWEWVDRQTLLRSPR
jgi:hypothetical protein